MTTPYYADEYVTLYHGSCLEVTSWLAADVLITDPPYGLGTALVTTEKAPDWDTDLAVRDAAVAMWGDRPYAVFGSPFRLDGALPCREFPLVWNKGGVGMGDLDFPFGRSYELIYVNGRGWHGGRRSSILNIQHSTRSATLEGHPTPKPVPLMEVLVRAAPPGVIADPFSGSGATLVAAKNEGRRAVGVELNERYCELAARRLTQEVLDLGLG